MDDNVELKGRKRIFTDVKQITEKNIISVLQEAMLIHQPNAIQMLFLLNYEKGVQPLSGRRSFAKK